MKLLLTQHPSLTSRRSLTWSQETLRWFHTVSGTVHGQNVQWYKSLYVRACAKESKKEGGGERAGMGQGREEGKEGEERELMCK
jgi:hypothetical protein